ncbi:MAG TPA: hypothetical protein PKL54_03415, partial [Candidatus Hydrogenedentes bacterium]|nr:hypothetical protein [Candidatus Hydrogenedentota bacterium]HOC71833.1 hypothetical protein [Candidatus Hydrogenedentota bacterium]
MKHPGVKCILLLVLAALAAFSASPALADAAAAPAQKSAADELLGNPMIALFAVIGAGMLFGRIQVFGVSFGSSGVIFSALLLGGVGYGIPAGIGNLGLVLFVYCVGLTAGPTFFRVFKQEGANLAKLGAVIILAGAATTVVCAWLFKVPVDLAAGVLAGSMTSTPALASALDALNHNPNVSVGYGIAYVYGVVGVVLFVQLVPRMLGYNLEEEVRRAGKGGGGRRIERVVIEVLNPG